MFASFCRARSRIIPCSFSLLFHSVPDMNQLFVLQANGQSEGTPGATDENTDTNDSAASGPESSLSPSEAPDVPSVDMEDSSASESVTPATQPTQRVNPLKWTVSLLSNLLLLIDL